MSTKTKGIAKKTKKAVEQKASRTEQLLKRLYPDLQAARLAERLPKECVVMPDRRARDLLNGHELITLGIALKKPDKAQAVATVGSRHKYPKNVLAALFEEWPR